MKMTSLVNYTLVLIMEKTSRQEMLREKIQMLYWERGLTMKETANALKLTSIQYWMNKLGIPRRSLSKAISGQRNPFYGKRHTSESKRKISEGLKGRIPWNKDREKTAIYRRKMREEIISTREKGLLNGRTWTESEVKILMQLYPLKSTREIANILKRSPFSVYHKASRLGITKTSETISTIWSSAHRGHPGLKGKKNPMYGRTHTEKAKKKISETFRRLFSNPDYKRKKLAHLLKGRIKQGGKSSKIEEIMYEALSRRGIEVRRQYPIAGRYLADFCIPSMKVIIECDGDYWHNLPEILERDKKKDLYLKKYGWKVLRFSEREIRKDVSSCVDKILLQLRR